jgi:hypothetical protein
MQTLQSLMQAKPEPQARSGMCGDVTVLVLWPRPVLPVTGNKGTDVASRLEDVGG